MTDSAPSVGTATRTLLAAGFTITHTHRQPGHIELECERPDQLGAVLRYLVVITEAGVLSDSEATEVAHLASQNGRALLLIAAEPGEAHLAWDDFVEGLGGAIPSWRALSEDYGAWLETAASNRLPEGFEGEAWALFEDLTADGLEFMFGRRAQRFGRRKRGKPVSDVITLMPNLRLLVVDSKAAGSGFDSALPNLRPLGEYVERQVERQRGHNEVAGALVVSSSFRQETDELTDISLRFNARHGTVVSFLSASDLASMVEQMRSASAYRNAISWQEVFRGGLVGIAKLEAEIADARSERYRGTGGA